MLSLDKTIVFPYHDEQRLLYGGGGSSPTGKTGKPLGKRDGRAYANRGAEPALERKQLQNLVMHAQGPMHAEDGGGPSNLPPPPQQTSLFSALLGAGHVASHRVDPVPEGARPPRMAARAGGRHGGVEMPSEQRRA